MGWWDQTIDGHSFAGGIRPAPEDGGHVWGDGPADIIDNALDEIEKVYFEAWGRFPTKAEVFAGLRFSIRIKDDWPGEID